MAAVAVSWAALVSAAAAEKPDGGAPTARNIVVDFSTSLGKLRPLHGVNNGPFVAGYHTADMAARHKEAGFPGVRLHDCHWPNPNVVDVPSIFPLFHADADDPRNYLFAPTDRYLAAIVANGSEIVYRLGVSIEHKTDFRIYPPDDFQKWAKICINIIRHYNDGWANGFHYNIRYYEIWNEPEGGSMWRGTRQQYFDLYRIAATALKAYNPALKIGGPVACGTDSPIVRPFLAYCRDGKVPLDFFDWHCYGDSLPEMMKHAAQARALLDEFGFKATESRCTEWRPMIAGFDQTVARPERPASTVRAAFARNRNHEAAAYAASALMQMQDSRVDMAYFYTADDSPWSMFDEFGVPGKAFFAFKAFNRLLQTPNRVAVAGAPGGDALTLCAGVADDRKTAAVLLSNYRGEPNRLQITLKDLPMTGKVRVERYVVDEKHEFEPLAEESLEAANPVLNLTMPPATVCLVRLISQGGR
jgi:hypothetical protein